MNNKIYNQTLKCLSNLLNMSRNSCVRAPKFIIREKSCKDYTLQDLKYDKTKIYSFLKHPYIIHNSKNYQNS